MINITYKVNLLLYLSFFITPIKPIEANWSIKKNK